MTEAHGKTMAGRKKKTSVKKVRVAHELPKRRRTAIDEAMKAHQTEDRPEWDRHPNGAMSGFIENASSSGTLRTVHLPLL